MIAEYGVGDDDGRDNDDGWVDEVEELDPDERLTLEKSILPVKLALVKLRRLAYKVIHSTTIVLPVWHKILEDLQAPITLMPRDVSTRWNSTFDMLDYAIEHREAVDIVTQRRDLGLRKFELNDEEWAIAEQLRGVLKATLNRYYQLTDQSEVYRIAMVLHPRHKLVYFRNARWEDDWVTTAEELVRDRFTLYSALDANLQDNDLDMETLEEESHKVRLFLTATTDY
ncbi:hypothetical protein EV424DRAFT_1326917 [Suillus variegatus]|nr:hypothetical protein EV424DRAFT_1326917 [Suillus variegatus]